MSPCERGQLLLQQYGFGNEAMRVTGKNEIGRFILVGGKINHFNEAWLAEKNSDPQYWCQNLKLNFNVFLKNILNAENG